ncbi:ABC transporter substrate-binding protein [Cryobacterium sp. Y11]|uniref:ABC transporter substrate-binding protein n=1 Tax=Cryobacterium sp. Y11 TaxID=2045016 RepID=UPI000CE2BEA2|nr:ABC transporter substrate-binding protein [Cryobacterium sp. Y11]
MTGSKTTFIATMALAVLFATTSCAEPPANTARDEVASAAASVSEESWPRTVTVGESSVTIAAKPVRIAALSSETGDLALALADPSRFVAIAAGSVAEGTGTQLAAAGKVGTVLPAGTTPDPERVLALNPDLVLLTGRHGGEQQTQKVLEELGIPVLAFSSADFASLGGLENSIDVLGAALGQQADADALISELHDMTDAVIAQVAGVTDSPRVLSLMARGGKVFILSAESMLNSLVGISGGDAIAVSSDITAAIPADVETIVAMNPDVILVEDFQGAGLAPFEALLGHAALAAVPAIVDSEVHTVSSTLASATSGLNTADGLAVIAELLHGF